MTQTISTDRMFHSLTAICTIIEEQKDYLSDLDGAIGDGDHGVNMAKCFREVRKKLADDVAGRDIATLLKDVGMVVLNSVGGAMGALYGTIFLKLSQASTGKAELTLNDLVALFQAAEKGILDIGKAKVGDKTLLDTLSPAVRSLEKSCDDGASLEEALVLFREAAEVGMASTRDLIARMGRASRLGERTIGHIDAGAASCCLILTTMAKAWSE